MARYDGIADWYDTDFLGEVHATGQATAIRLLGRGPGRLLDLGCGTGAKTVAFRDAAWEVTGVDISDAMLRRAPDRGLDIVQADAAGLPFDDATFDARAMHLTLGSFVQSFVDAGLTLERFEELGRDNRPFRLAVALRWRR